MTTTTAAIASATTTPTTTVPHRDVIVWGHAPMAHTVTEILRTHAGLSVDSWLLPPTSPERTLTQLVHDLSHGKIPPSWGHAPVVITMWASTLRTERTAYDATMLALATAQRHIHGQYGGSPLHVDLSPAPAPAIHATPVRAPCLLSPLMGRCLLTPAAARALHEAAQTYQRRDSTPAIGQTPKADDDQVHATDRALITARVLRALGDLPPAPGMGGDLSGPT